MGTVKSVRALESMAGSHQHGEEEGDNDVFPQQVLVGVQHHAADGLQDE